MEARLIGKLCFVDCVLLALIFETSCAPRSAQLSSRFYPRAWFVGALGAPGSTLACLMPSEWDRSPFVTEGVGNPTAESKKHLRHHHDRSRRSTHTHSKMHRHYQHPPAPRSQHFCACVWLDIHVRSHCRASVFIIVIVCMTKGRIACIAVVGTILDGLIELHTCPVQKVCDWIPYSRSKWRSRPQWSKSLSSQSSSDGCICRISWFSVDAIRCHRCLPSCREQQAFDCAHGGR